MVRALRALGAERRLVPARPDRRRLRAVGARPCARLAAARHRDCWSPSTARSPPSRRSPRPAPAGLDVVVTDHHAPRADGALPDCPIVHPALCGYPCPELCGTGVAYKLAQALGAPHRRRGPRARGAGDGRRPGAAARREPPAGARRACAALANTAKPGPAGADGGRPGRPERAGHPRARLPAGAADQRRRAAAPRRRRARAAADRRRAARRGRSPPSSTRSTPSAARSSSGSCGRPRRRCAELGDAQRVRAGAEGWHPGVIGIVASRIVERHHRPAILIALDGELGHGLGPEHPRLRPARRRCTRPPVTWSATAGTARPPG